MLPMPELQIDGQPLTDAEQRLVLVMLLDATVKLSQRIAQGDAQAQRDYAMLYNVIDRIAGREPRNEDQVRAYIRQQLMPQRQPTPRQRRNPPKPA